MENQYGITIKNKYDLFLGDQDPYEILQIQEQLKADRKTEKAKKSAAGNDKESKSAKNKQIKAAVVSQETKVEKIDATPSPPKKEDKPRRNKPVKTEDGPQPEAKPKDKLLGKAGSTPQRSKEDTFLSSTEFGHQTEFGHFEVRPSDRGGNRERRTRDGFGDRQERGGGNRDRGEGRDGRPEGRERSDRGFGRERRPRGRYMGSRPPRRGGFSDDRQRGGTPGDEQEKGLFAEGEQGAFGFGEKRGFSDHSGEKGGFSDQYERKSSEDQDRRGGGFTDHGGFDEERQYEDRQDRGNFERRTFERRGGFGERRSFEDRQDRGGYGERKRRGGGFGEQQDNQSIGHWSEKPGDGEDREIRRGRGGFNRRGRGRGRPGFGRREFDRRGGGSDQSGGGVRPTDKREGSGAHNWGTTMDDLDGQTESQAVADGATWGEQAEAAENQEAAGASSANLLEEKPDGPAAEDITEEEPKVMTLDEWKMLQATKRVKPEYNIRKPGEGCSGDPQWKKMVPLTRKNVKEQSDEDEEEESEEDKHAKSKNVFPIEITFTDNPRRGGRGGRRGGGGTRGSGRGYTPDGGGYRSELRKSPSRRGDREGGGRRGARERAPNVADEHDFPSLDKTVAVQ